MTEAWTKKTLLTLKNDKQQLAIVGVEDDKISLTTGFQSGGHVYLGDPVLMTPNMAGDLAHSLNEAVRRVEE